MSRASRLAALALTSLSDRGEEAWLLARDKVRRRRPVGSEERSLPAALLRGLSFLRSRQRRDGQFRGFMLLPGASTHWITAHVALVLEEVAEARDICRAAAGYLARTLEAQGGCGYNSRVGHDCDSTAQALLAVHRFGVPYPSAAFDRLLAAQRPAGGFPTYATPSDDPEPNGWHAAHADVTAVAIMALRRLNGPTDRIVRAEAWLAGQARDGLLPAYWWPEPGYGLWVQCRAGFGIERAADAAARLLPGARAQPALAMLTIAASADESRSLARAEQALLDGQDRDGSWPCAPCLRVTARRCDTASPANPGRCHADRRRVLSTAYALAALARLQLRPS